MLKRRKLIVLFVFLGVAAGVAVALFFLLSPKKPTMTVNGEDIPVEESIFINLWGSNQVGFIGEKGNDIYIVHINFEEGFPSENTTYNLKNREDLGKFSVSFQHANKAENINVLVRPADLSEAEVSVGNFTENEIIGISASGKLSKDGREYDFTVSGEAKYSDYKEIFK